MPLCESVRVGLPDEEMLPLLLLVDSGDAEATFDGDGESVDESVAQCVGVTLLELLDTTEYEKGDTAITAEMVAFIDDVRVMLARPVTTVRVMDVVGEVLRQIDGDELLLHELHMVNDRRLEEDVEAQGETEGEREWER